MKQPMNPVDYVVSPQVGVLINMIIDSRPRSIDNWDSPDDRRFNDGYRHGMNIIYRALVELETGITDPDDLDRLCADLINDVLEIRG